MSPTTLHAASAHGGLSELARRPRASDGVGNALRQVFRGGYCVPADLRDLLHRLDKDD